MKRIRSIEKGQAFAEFVIALIPVMFIFVGILVVAIIGREQIRTVIESRGQVDSASSSGTVLGGVQPEYLTGKNNTPGALPYLPDGTFNTGDHVIDYAQFFTSDYKNNLNVFAYRLDELHESGITTFDYTMVNFLEAASLSGTALDRGDPLQKYDFPYLSSLARMFFGYSFSCSDKVFMPSRVE